jgi:hypothetical protein
MRSLVIDGFDWPVIGAGLAVTLAFVVSMVALNVRGMNSYD